MKRIVAILAVALAACGPKVGPDLRREFPSASEALASIEPACKRPTPINYEGCRRAAMMLDSDPARATVLFLGTWEAVEMGDLQGPQDLAAAYVGSAFAAEVASDTELGALLLLPVLAVGIAADVDADQHWQAGMAAERITLRVLQKIYEANDDPYSVSMRPVVSQVRFGSAASLAAFTTAHMMTMQRTMDLVTIPGSAGSVTMVPPGSAATLEDAQGAPSGEAILVAARAKAAEPYMPTGQGPVAFKPLRDGWKVVEAGKRVDLRTAEGNRLRGRVTACSPRAIAVKPAKDVPVVVVELEHIATLTVR